MTKILEKAGGVLNKMNPFSSGELKPSQEDYITALTDMQAGRTSKSKNARAMQATIRSYIETKLNHGDSIAPGAFRTKFKHILRADSLDAVAPEGASMKSMEGIVQELVSAALVHAKDPETVPQCNVFTMDDAINGRDPSIGNNLPQLGMPVHGQDGHDNSVYLLLPTHPQMGELVKQFKKSHGEPEALGHDTFAWARAAWLSALMQLSKDEILAKLKGVIPGDNDQTAHRIADLAERVKAGKGIYEILSQKSATDATGVLEYPDDVKKNDGAKLEDDLKKMQGYLLQNKKDVHSKPIMKEVKPGDDAFGHAADHPAGSSHIFSLTNALGATAVVHGDGRGTESSLNDTVCLSCHGASEAAGRLIGEDKQLHVATMYETCINAKAPLIVRMGNGAFAVRAYDATVEVEKDGEKDVKDVKDEVKEENDTSTRPQFRPGGVQPPAGGIDGGASHQDPVAGGADAGGSANTTEGGGSEGVGTEERAPEQAVPTGHGPEHPVPEPDLGQAGIRAAGGPAGRAESTSDSQQDAELLRRAAEELRRGANC